MMLKIMHRLRLLAIVFCNPASSFFEYRRLVFAISRLEALEVPTFQIHTACRFELLQRELLISQSQVSRPINKPRIIRIAIGKCLLRAKRTCNEGEFRIGILIDVFSI